MPYPLRTTVATAWLLASTAGSAQVNDDQTVLSIDHYIRHVSTAPSMRGEVAQLYLRERVLGSAALRDTSLAGRVVLFVHGAGTPAEVAFDPPHEGYSWMAYLAEQGFDVFSVDMTGYGRSTRPTVMNDPCNLSGEQQASLIPALLPEICEPSHGHHATTIQSDWDDIDAAVDYIRALRGVDRVALFGWSLGGPRAGGYAARHPDKVSSLVLLAPAYARDRGDAAADGSAAEGPVFTKQSHTDFIANWDRQVGCEEQYEPAVADSVWSAMLASDPVGATWGRGVRRAPRTTVWGWDEAIVSSTGTPTLIVAGLLDAQVPADRVRELFDDLGSERKVLLEMACSSHNAMWERDRLRLFAASLEWLASGTVDGRERGVVTDDD